MRTLLWKLWLRCSGQEYPEIRGRSLRNPFGSVYVFAPEESYPAWVNLSGEFMTYGTWPPLLGDD